MADRNGTLDQLNRWRADWDKGKEGLAEASDRPLEVMPTRAELTQCEMCGSPLGVRVYYDDASTKERAFCSLEHVTVYRDAKKVA